MAERFNLPFESTLDANGDPLSGAKLYFYTTGTSSPINTYSNDALSSANSNPVVADSSGRFADIFLSVLTYKVVLKTSADVTVTTMDPVFGGATALILSEPLETNGQQVRWSKGADVASATALTLTSTGNYWDITGTTAITSIGTLGIGTVVRLHFDSALVLTHDATDLVLLGGANITTVAGDEAEFVEYATGDWRMTSYSRVSAASVSGITPTESVVMVGNGTDFVGESGSTLRQSIGGFVQAVHTSDTAADSGTTAIPDDDTIPQNTEGDEYMTATITPKNTANRLVIEVVVNGSDSVSGTGAAALFQDATADALACGLYSDSTTGHVQAIVFRHEMAAGTISATTFKVRAGTTAGTFTFNGISAARKYGGVLASSLRVTEYGA